MEEDGSKSGDGPVALIESRGLTDLISFDQDIDRVATITRKEPDDGGPCDKMHYQSH
jgi:hypothetical protein